MAKLTGNQYRPIFMGNKTSLKWFLKHGMHLESMCRSIENVSEIISWKQGKTRQKCKTLWFAVSYVRRYSTSILHLNAISFTFNLRKQNMFFYQMFYETKHTGNGLKLQQASYTKYLKIIQNISKEKICIKLKRGVRCYVFQHLT